MRVSTCGSGRLQELIVLNVAANAPLRVVTEAA